MSTLLESEGCPGMTWMALTKDSFASSGVIQAVKVCHWVLVRGRAAPSVKTSGTTSLDC